MTSYEQQSYCQFLVSSKRQYSLELAFCTEVLGIIRLLNHSAYERKARRGGNQIVLWGQKQKLFFKIFLQAHQGIRQAKSKKRMEEVAHCLSEEETFELRNCFSLIDILLF